MTELGLDSLFVCDEVQKFTKPAFIPQPLKEIMQTGRRFNIDTALMSQQPNELANSLRNQVTEFISYRHTDPTALDWIEKMSLSREVISSLPDLTYIWRNTQTGEQRQGKIDYPVKA